MARLTLTIPDDVHQELRARAQGEGISVAALVRRAIDLLPRSERVLTREQRRELMQRTLSVVGKHRSGLTDVAERHDDYFVEAIMHWQRDEDPAG